SYLLTATNGPVNFGASGLPAGLQIDPNTGLISGVPSATGLFDITLTATNAAGSGVAQLFLDIAQAPAVVAIGSSDDSVVRKVYDGLPQEASAETFPSGLAVAYTYNGSATPPTLPGTYAVVATVVDPNHRGSAEGTLVIG